MCIIITYRDVSKMRDYGKSVRWPEAPRAIRPMVGILKGVHARWRAWMILRAVPKEEWPQLRLKVFYSVKCNYWIQYLYCISTISREKKSFLGWELNLGSPDIFVNMLSITPSNLNIRSMIMV